MHDESQISNGGEIGYVTLGPDYKGRPYYCCKRCGKKSFSLENIKEHYNNCAFLDGKEEYINYVVCNICGWCSKKLNTHLKAVHNLDTKEYDGYTICLESQKTYGLANGNNGSWYKKAVDRGDDLTQYKEKMGKALSESIMSNPESRGRRAAVMANVNKSDMMRKKASETAKKTSARPEIQKQRAKQLKNWRDSNPIDFYNKCIHKVSNSFQSKPELALFDFVSNIDGFCFKRNQFLISETFLSKTKRKQIDIMDRDKNLYIEFDGALHFKETSFNQLDRTKKSDKLLDKYVIDNEHTLIRVSYEEFSYSKYSYGFSKVCIDKLLFLLKDIKPGVYYIGGAYGKH